MKAQDIENMPAGRELDALVAKSVMRDVDDPWHQTFDCGYPDCIDCTCNCPKYSTDIAAAWLVVEKLRELGFSKIAIEDGAQYAWEYYTEDSGMGRGFGTADTLPLAICRAALKAVSQENDK